MGNYLKEKAKALAASYEKPKQVGYTPKELSDFAESAAAAKERPPMRDSNGNVDFNYEELKKQRDATRLAYEKGRDTHIEASKSPSGYLPRQDPSLYSSQANRESRNQNHKNYEDWQPGDGLGKKYDPKFIDEVSKPEDFASVNTRRAALGLKPLSVSNPNPDRQEMASKTALVAPKPELAPVNAAPAAVPQDNFAESSIRRIAALSEENRKRTQ